MRRKTVAKTEWWCRDACYRVRRASGCTLEAMVANERRKKTFQKATALADALELIAVKA